MQETLTQSALLSRIPGLVHGFRSNHSPGGRDELDALEPGVATVKQVHGDRTVWVTGLEKRTQEADGIATTQPDLAVGVYSADCSPILVCAVGQDGKPRAVMAVHGGWRGTAQAIAAKSLEAFVDHFPRKQNLRFIAAIGPCISFESFEVGEEVVQAFPGSLERGQARFLRMEGDKKKFLFDLPGENARQLRETAQRLSVDLQLEVLPLCTFQRKDLFPSYRRDREKAGRILSYLRFRG